MQGVPSLLACTLVAFAAGCGGDSEGAADQPAAAGKPPAPVAGDERDFPPGKLAAGELVTCAAGGLTAKIAVPKRQKRGFVTSTVVWTKDGSARIRLDVRPTGRVVARCS